MVAMVPPCVSCTALVFSAVLVLGCGFKVQDNHRDNVEPQKCIAPVAIEGQTAELTFFIRHDALQHETFFATLRRHRDLGSDILVCDRSSPIKCHIVNNTYSSGQIVKDSLTLQIPNVTSDFQDTYVLQAYANNSPEPSNECQLRVIGKQEKQRCLQSEVSPGEIAVLEFPIAQEVLSDHRFFAYLKRTNKAMSDIVVCRRNSPVICDVFTPGYRTSGIEDGSLTVYIPDVSKAFEDTYVFQAYKGRRPEAPVCRKLLVRAIETEDNNEVSIDSGTLAAIVTLAVLLPVVLVCLVIFRKRIPAFCQLTFRRSNRHYYSEKRRYFRRGWCGSRHGSERDYSLEEMLQGVLEMKQLIEPKNKLKEPHEDERWFMNRLTKDDEIKFLQSETTGPGSFVVTADDLNPYNFLLVAYFGGELKKFRIIQTDDGFKLLDTNRDFETLTKLVNYYKHLEIKVSDSTLGKLTTHFRRRPEEEWYFGKISKEDERQLLHSADQKPPQPGSFLIRDGTTAPDDYILAAYFEGRMAHFPISEQDNGFRIQGTRPVFTTMAELVDNYHKNDLSFGSHIFGKLSTPFKREQLDRWYLETFTPNDEQFLQSGRKQEGSYLVTTGSTDPIHLTLAVYFGGAIKRFTIIKEGKSYGLLDTGRSFRTLSELLSYYRAHPIATGTKVWGKLTKRFSLEPDPVQKWYFKDFTEEKEERLLKSVKCIPGSFLIRDEGADSENYILSVQSDEGVVRFTILTEENGFCYFRDADTLHRRLEDLVAYYTETVIRAGDKEYCKLVQPFGRESMTL